MNDIDRAVETTEQIRDALAAEIVLTRDERVLIRNMDVEGMNRRAVKRSEFNNRTSALQQVLAGELARLAFSLGLKEVTLDVLRRHAPVLGGRMTEVRALASALSELDNLNRLLGQRALSYVRAHLAVLCPKPSTYDRRGGSATGARASTVVRVL